MCAFLAKKGNEDWREIKYDFSVQQIVKENSCPNKMYTFEFKHSAGNPRKL